eukprot:scaffold2578_cov129-Isochrysis_galbana.AAC.1
MSASALRQKCKILAIASHSPSEREDKEGGPEVPRLRSKSFSRALPATPATGVAAAAGAGVLPMQLWTIRRTCAGAAWEDEFRLSCVARGCR